MRSVVEHARREARAIAAALVRDGDPGTRWHELDAWIDELDPESASAAALAFERTLDRSMRARRS